MIGDELFKLQGCKILTNVKEFIDKTSPIS